MKGWYLKIILGKGIWFFTTRGTGSELPSELDGTRSLFLDEKTSVWKQELIWTNNRNRACSVQISDNVIGVHRLLLILGLRNTSQDYSPVDLYLISEKNSIWKNQVWRTGFLVYFDLNFYCLCSLQKSISKLIFAG